MVLHHLIWAFLVYTVASQTCDESNGWYQLEGDCFRVSRSAPETQMTWYEARETCLAEGGDLASIHSPVEQAFILTLATNIGLVGPHLWIGMNQLDARSGTFSWIDGSATAWTNWATSQPTSGGLTMCAYTVTEPGPGPFEYYPGYSALYGIMNPDYDWPTDADNVNTFYFGQNYAWSYIDCQNRCEAHPDCAAAIFWNYHYNYYWDHVCMGRTDFFNALGPDYDASSGIRTLGGGDAEGWWYGANCGLNNGVACRKVVGSDAPITIPPTPVVESFCPDGYFSADRERGNKCFRVVEIPSETQGFRWEQALIVCRSGPGNRPDLASIQSIDENAVISSHIQTYGWNYWIGLHYTSVHNSWVWADNDESSYFNWAPGRPAGIYGDYRVELEIFGEYHHTGLLQDASCVEMWSLSGPGGQWGNQLCDQRRGFICQTFKDADNIIPTPAFTTPHDCAAGWIPYWYGCYQFQSELRTWTAARDYCASQGATLASIHAEPENSAIFYGADGSFPLWIGLTKNQTSGAYIWVDGWGVFYQNFDDGGQDNGEGCVMMESNGLWNDIECSASHASVCKQTDQPPPTVDAPDGTYCPVDWIKWGLKCYYFSSISDNWSGALTDCRVRGANNNGDLVTIDNEQENHFVYSTLDLRSTSYAWIGLYRYPTMPNYTWVDGSNGDYRKWAPNEPSNPINELCAEMHVNSNPSFWFDEDCSYSQNYICEGDQVPEPTYPTIPTSAPGECPSPEWFKFENSTDCYLVRPIEYLSWHGALDSCKRLTGGRGSLATITSYKENQQIWFLGDLLTPSGTYPLPSIWIGLSKTGNGYPYEWEDEHESTFRWWAPGEPNDVDGSQNCVRMYLFVSPTEGEWDDFYCHETSGHGYACKTAQGSYAHLDIDEVKFVPEAEKKLKESKLVEAEAEPDLLVEDSPHTDVSQITVGSVLGLVALCVVSVAVVFVVYKKKQKSIGAGQEEEMSFENPLSIEVPQSASGDVEQQQNTHL